MTRIGGSWSAPIAIPMALCPRTILALRPVGVLASTQIRSGWRPAAMLASASYRASRTSSNAWRTSLSMIRTYDVGPSRSASYPAAANLSVHRGGIRPAGLPSMTRSTPSIIRPASRPGVRWTARWASCLTRSESILMAFALRGAPCGYRSHRIAGERACHPQEPTARAEAQDRVSNLGPRVISIDCDHLLLVAPDGHCLAEADAVLPQVRPCFGWIPGLAHPGDRRAGRSSVAHSLLMSRLTSNLSSGSRRVGTA